jgi:hypothetical protein
LKRDVFYKSLLLLERIGGKKHVEEFVFYEDEEAAKRADKYCVEHTDKKKLYRGTLKLR